MRLTLSVFAIFLAGATPAAAHHEQGAPPHELRVIRSYAPDLMHRELRRVPVSWSHLRRMVASRWRATHPAAEWHRRLSDLIYEPTPTNNRTLAREYLAHRGYSTGDFECMDWIVWHESSWVVDVYNIAGSGAYGIPQSLPGEKMASAGADWKTNPLTQIRWMLAYAEGRYGSMCAAYAHRVAKGWY